MGQYFIQLRVVQKCYMGLFRPADDFMSTCTSCHSTAQFVPAGKKSSPWVQDPNPQQIVVDGVPSIWVQKDEEAIKKW